MTLSKAETLLSIAATEGLQQAIKTTSEYLYWSTKAGIFGVTVSDAVVDEHSKKVLVEPASEEGARYTGVHETVPKSFSNHLGETTTSEKFFRVLSDARIVGPECVISRSGKIILPNALGWENKNRLYKRRFAEEYGFRDWASLRFGRRREVGDCFLLSSRLRGWTNFGLWFYETLPKLYWYEKYVRSVDDAPTIVTPELAEYQRKALRRVGYGPDDYLELDDAILEPSRLVVPPQPGHHRGEPWDLSARSIRWVRDELTRDVDASCSPERIYISRDDAGWRAVSNEERVMGLLEDYGFEKYVLSELDILEQIRLFTGANVVIGPHGAGNAHMVHASECTWLEIFPGKEAVKPFYFTLANRLGHEYEFLIADPAGFQHPKKRDARHRDLTVDLDQLRALTEAILGSES